MSGLGGLCRVKFPIPRGIRQCQAVAFIKVVSCVSLLPPLWPLTPLTGTRSPGQYSKPFPSLAYKGRGPVPCLSVLTFRFLCTWLIHTCTPSMHAHVHTHICTHTRERTHTQDISACLLCGPGAGPLFLPLPASVSGK